MINNQFGRRNLSNYQRSVLALELESVFSERAKENQGQRTDIIQISEESKPIVAIKEVAKLESVFSERAKEQQIRKPESVIQISEEQKPIVAIKEIAKIANVSHDTITMVKKIEVVASEEKLKIVLIVE